MPARFFLRTDQQAAKGEEHMEHTACFSDFAQEVRVTFQEFKGAVVSQIKPWLTEDQKTLVPSTCARLAFL